ncbi:MAG: response regulator transcription factor [Flavobacterium sp.]|jgi:DNA-binding NarL/FixJ family response regulator|uniref:response regulator transcription factor n=1 Tax=Flavobacterium sp. TaxID=239 RepID=UPI002D1FBE52|nr:response regulator transcription factor [Flavobacterium sp.]
MIKLAIVDDNSFLIQATRQKLALFSDFIIKCTAINGIEIIRELEKNSNYDLILMDIEMPKLDGIGATEIIKQKFPHIKIIMLTVFDNDANIFNAIKAGADGYLLKEVSPDELKKGILETLNGGATMTPSIAMKTLNLFRNPTLIEPSTIDENIKLTTREIEVLEQLSKGLKYDAIANNLILSSGTIRKHVENIYNKLKVHNKLEAIQKAKNNNLI